MSVYIYIIKGRHLAARLQQNRSQEYIYVGILCSILPRTGSSFRALTCTHTQCFRSILNGTRFIAGPEDLCTVRTRDVNLLLFIQMTCTVAVHERGVDFPFFRSISLSLFNFFYSYFYLSSGKKIP